MCLEQEQQKYKPRFKKTNPEIKKKKKNENPFGSRLQNFKRTSMKLAGLKFVENSHNESVWAATWVPATET